MRAFRFRLEKVLDWYGEKCRMEQNRLAACLSALSEVQAAMARLQAERLGIERDLVSRTSMSAGDLVAFGFYRLRVRKQESELQSERDRRDAAVREQRAKLLAARRRLKLLEKLRERRLAEYTYEADRELEALASDAYLAKWSR